MGGNAIKKLGVDSIRVNKDVYLNTIKNIEIIFSEFTKKYPDIAIRKYKVYKTFESKESFGDLDILIELTHPDNRDNFEKYFNMYCCGDVLSWVKNGPVSSFACDVTEGIPKGSYFQIDLNYVTDPDIFDIQYFYHGNGDFGNLAGRIAHSMGLKYGHDGLYYIHRNDNYIIGEILLSRDPVKILKFLGLDNALNYLTDSDGIIGLDFNTNEEIYDVIVSSPYFHYSQFDLEQRNHVARMRDRKRPSYNGFLDYVKLKGLFTEDISRIVDKDYAIIAIDHFGKIDELNKLQIKEAKRLYSKACLYPQWVSTVSGKTDRELGNAMMQLKENFTSDYLYSMTIGDARRKVLEFIQKEILQ